jgi:hypothetical protein
MSTLVRRRRGTTEEHAVFAGALGEITVDTDMNTLRVHDGATLGGFPLAKLQDLDNVITEDMKTAISTAFATVNTRVTDLAEEITLTLEAISTRIDDMNTDILAEIQKLQERVAELEESDE